MELKSYTSRQGDVTAIDSNSTTTPNTMAEEGHAKVATMMSHYNEFAIFRKFSKLNYQNLLYLQAELTHLEANLKKLADRDGRDPNRTYYSKDWWFLAQNEEEHDSREQWQKFLQIRNKLKEYNEQLAQAVFLTSLRPPTKYDLTFVTDWMKRKRMGDFPLCGLDRNIWSPESTDLLAIHRRTSSSPFTHYRSNTLIPYLHRILLHHYKKPVQHDPESGICKYDERRIERVMDILVTVLASLIPIASILILYFVANTLDRLAIAVAFTGMFAFCLAVMTRARRVEVFAATSAFAAVLVVFVTGNNAAATA